MQNDTKDTKKLIVEIPEEIHTTIKLKAILKNISMKTWVLRVIVREIEKEAMYE